MSKDVLTPKEVAWLHEAAMEIAQYSSLIGQISLSPLLSEKTREELSKTQVQLTGISARLSRIEIVSDKTDQEHWVED